MSARTCCVSFPERKRSVFTKSCARGGVMGAGAACCCCAMAVGLWTAATMGREEDDDPPAQVREIQLHGLRPWKAPDGDNVVVGGAAITHAAANSAHRTTNKRHKGDSGLCKHVSFASSLNRELAAPCGVTRTRACRVARRT